MVSSSGVPERMCIGCRARAPQTDLIRLVLQTEPIRIAVDEGRVLPGRGAWLHPQTDCLERAVKKSAFAAAFKQKIPRSAYEDHGKWLQKMENK
ncbi:YlxR family protein [Brevibacterium ravenspurgense]|uniref:YlxR family protein n=1 Tax=Brevibacterium ravenspurgense TaxID=479117 RepID=UPI0012DE56D8|nr:YlxR family protein [Brevibacterium ravenspurgense]HJH13182.1 YlxR family protein [Brevibacterium ravenspurgense]